MLYYMNRRKFKGRIYMKYLQKFLFLAFKPCLMFLTNEISTKYCQSGRKEHYKEMLSKIDE